MCTGQVQKFIRESVVKYKPQPPIIDLGSGDEYLQYKTLFNPWTFTLLDISQNAHKTINIFADICNMLCVQPETYSTVLFFETLEHIYNPLKAFQEIARILKPNGLLLGSTVSCWPEHKHPKDYWRFLPDGIEELCKAANLNILENKMDPNTATLSSHVFFVARKP